MARRILLFVLVCPCLMFVRFAWAGKPWLQFSEAVCPTDPNQSVAVAVGDVGSLAIGSHWTRVYVAGSTFTNGNLKPGKRAWQEHLAGNQDGFLTRYDEKDGNVVCMA